VWELEAMRAKTGERNEPIKHSQDVKKEDA